jgi:hypothetical protein
MPKWWILNTNLMESRHRLTWRGLNISGMKRYGAILTTRHFGHIMVLACRHILIRAFRRAFADKSLYFIPVVAEGKQGLVGDYAPLVKAN